MPTAWRRACGSGEAPGSEICSSAISALELGDAALDVGGEALDEHQPAYLARRCRRVLALVERGSEPLARQSALAPELALDRVDLVARLGLLERFAPRQLLV